MCVPATSSKTACAAEGAADCANFVVAMNVDVGVGCVGVGCVGVVVTGDDCLGALATASGHYHWISKL